MDEIEQALLTVIDPPYADLPFDDAADAAIAVSEAERIAPLVVEFVAREARRIVVAAAT